VLNIWGRREFWCGKLKESDHVEDLVVDKTIILNVSSRNNIECVELIYLAQNKDRYLVILNKAMKLRVL
jgi:UDP-glucose 6-dehydrogenase